MPTLPPPPPLRPRGILLASLSLLALMGPWMAPSLAREVAPEPRDSAFVALCFHDVVESAAALDADAQAVSTARLVELFEWLAAHRWTPVSVDQLLAARTGGRPLPPKAVLLTFDDGLASTYHTVFPLLRLYGYPAVVSVVDSWLDVPAGGTVDYGGRPRSREEFVTWSELREMAASGLVEVASHSHDLHRGVLANRAGNLQPAATSRRLLGVEPLRWEDEETFRRRLRQDLEISRRRLSAELGQAPRVLAWPFGEASGLGQAVARELGFTVTLGLRDGRNLAGEGQLLPGLLHRHLLLGNPSLADLVITLRHPEPSTPWRFASVGLQDLLPDAAGRELRLDRLLEEVRALGVNRLVVDVPSRDGPPSAIALDALNRAAWQLRTRLRVATVARFTGEDSHLAATAEALAVAAPLAGLVVTESSNSPRPERDEAVHRFLRHRPEAEIALEVNGTTIHPESDPASNPVIEPGREPGLRGHRWLLSLPADLSPARAEELAERLARHIPARERHRWVVRAEAPASDLAPSAASRLAERLGVFEEQGFASLGMGAPPPSSASTGDGALAQRTRDILAPRLSTATFPYPPPDLALDGPSPGGRP